MNQLTPNEPHLPSKRHAPRHLEEYLATVLYNDESDMRDLAWDSALTALPTAHAPLAPREWTDA
jgi:hypothetical protein